MEKYGGKVWRKSVTEKCDGKVWRKSVAENRISASNIQSPQKGSFHAAKYISSVQS